MTGTDSDDKKDPGLLKKPGSCYELINYISSTFRNSAGRANICTGSAIQAKVGIDHILGISLRNSLSGAFACAGATAYTLIRNYICHWNLPP